MGGAIESLHYDQLCQVDKAVVVGVIKGCAWKVVTRNTNFS